MPRPPEGPHPETEKDLVQIELVNVSASIRERTEKPFCTVYGKWEGNRFQVRRFVAKTDYGLNLSFIKRIAENLKIGDVVADKLKAYQGPDNAKLDLEADFGDDQTKWGAINLRKRAPAPGTKIPKYNFEDERIPISPNPLNVNEIKFSIKPDDRIGTLIIRASTEKRSADIVAEDPRDKEIGTLRRALNEARTQKEQSDKKTRELSGELRSEKNSRQAERLKLAEQLEAALRNPGFLKSDLVKTAQDLARRLKNGEEIK